jgi:hypothetical protein
VNRYLAAPLEPLEIASAPGPRGGIALQAGPFGGGNDVRPGPDVRTQYLVAELDAGCAFETVPLRLSYRASAYSVDFTETVEAPVGNSEAGSAYAFFPVYADGSGVHPQAQFVFERLTVPAPQAECVRRVSRVRNPDTLPVLFHLTLTPDWQRQPAHEEIRWRPSDTVTYVAPSDAPVRRDVPQGTPAFGNDIGVEFKAPIVKPISPAGVQVDGMADAPFTYLIRSRDTDRQDGACVLIEGELREGGFTAGLLEGEQWAVQLPVTEKGRFRILLNPPSGGRFALVLANYLPYSKRTSFTVDRAVWLPPPPPASAPAR